MPVKLAKKTKVCVTFFSLLNLYKIVDVAILISQFRDYPFFST